MVPALILRWLRVASCHQYRINNTPSYARRQADDFDGALGVASDEFCHAAKQETPDVSLPVRANNDQISAPLCRAIDDAFSDVTYSTAVPALNPAVRNSFAIRSTSAWAGSFSLFNSGA